MPVPDFSPGEVLTAAAMDSIGLWLIKTQTVGTGVATVTLIDCFNTNFSNYRILISNVTCSANGNGIKLLLDGISTAVYSSSLVFTAYSAAAPGGSGYVNDASGVFVGISSTLGTTHCVIDLFSPFLTEKKTYTFQSSQTTNVSSGGGLIDSTTSATGLTIDIDGAVTMTGGVISVYGYRN